MCMLSYWNTTNVLSTILFRELLTFVETESIDWRSSWLVCFCWNWETCNKIYSYIFLTSRVNNTTSSYRNIKATLIGETFNMFISKVSDEKKWRVRVRTCSMTRMAEEEISVGVVIKVTVKQSLHPWPLNVSTKVSNENLWRKGHLPPFLVHNVWCQVDHLCGSSWSTNQIFFKNVMENIKAYFFFTQYIPVKTWNCNWNVKKIWRPLLLNCFCI